MTPGVLAWDLVVGRAPRREQVGRTLAQALARFGVAAAFEPPGDIVTAGRKLAGIAGAFEGSTRLHQGGLLVAGDAAELAGRFCLPVRPVVALAELASPAPAMSEVAEVIAAAFSAAFGLPLRREALGRLELERAGDAALADAVP
jgi:lipoate-protein ligase A